MKIRRKMLTLLSRETSSGSMIPELDGIRFLAIAVVVLFHLWGNFTTYASGNFPIPQAFDLPAKLLNTGGVGVELFFIISGFILGLPFARHHICNGKKVVLAQYFKRRVVRLEPPYLINLLICFFLTTLVLKRVSVDSLWPNLLASSFYVHNIAFGKGSLVNYVAWSLEIEVQFYILAPILSMVFSLAQPRIRRGILIFAVLASSFGSTFLISQNPLFSMSLANFLQYFLMGFLLIDVYLGEWENPPLSPSLSDFFALLALCMIPAGHICKIPFFHLLEPWLMAVIVIGAFRGRIFNRLFSNPWIYTIGGMCYTIYLYHFLVIGFAGHGRLFFFNSFWPNVIVSFIIVPFLVLLFSSVMFVLVEKPFMRRNWHIVVLDRLRKKQHPCLGNFQPEYALQETVHDAKVNAISDSSRIDMDYKS